MLLPHDAPRGDLLDVDPEVVLAERGAVPAVASGERTMKHRIVHALQKYVFNPPVKALLAAGFVPPSYALLETIGRTSGLPRKTPVGNGLVGDTFWIVAEHGLTAGYVRNIQRNPSVRVKVRDRAIRSRWRTGIAHVVAEDDPRQRQRQISRGKPGRALNAFVVRTLGTGLLTVRIDLDPAANTVRTASAPHRR
jgi:deazaflavin-dependent oxidoreductase (nitroreductase family)